MIKVGWLAAALSPKLVWETEGQLITIALQTDQIMITPLRTRTKLNFCLVFWLNAESHMPGLVLLLSVEIKKHVAFVGCPISVATGVH